MWFLWLEVLHDQAAIQTREGLQAMNSEDKAVLWALGIVCATFAIMFVSVVVAWMITPY